MDSRSFTCEAGCGVRGRWRRGWVLASLVLAACGGGLGREEGAGASPVAEGEVAAREAPVHEGARLESRWLRTQGGTSWDHGWRVAVDAAGNTLVGFHYEGPADASSRALPWNGRAGDLHLGIAKYRPDGTFAWARGFSPPAHGDTSNWVRVDAMAVDPRGDVFLGGNTHGEASFDGKVVSGAFLAKLERDTGRVLWARGTRPEPGTVFTFQDFAADAEGNFVALARLADNRAPNSPLPYLMLTKYRGSDSTPLWDRIFRQTEGHVDAAEVAVDGGGNIFVGGAFAGRVHFGGPTPLEPLGNNDSADPYVGFILALTPQGGFRWNRALTTSRGSTFVSSIAAERSRVVVTAYGAATFQGAELPHGTHVLGFYSEDGGERWARHLTRISSTALVRSVGEEVVVVAEGDAALLGNPRQHGPSNPEWPSGDVFFVAKFWRTNGQYLGSRNVEQDAGGGTLLVPYDAALSPVDGEVAITGAFDHATDFGTGAFVTPRGWTDSFLLRLRH